MAKKIKKIYRSKNDRIIAGINGGLGEYFEIDSTIMRIIFILITIFTGVLPGTIAYFILWVIIPEK